MEDNLKTGVLINDKDVKLHRMWFEEMCKLIGITVIYKAPRKDKRYTDYGEFDGHFYEPIAVGCIFEEHPKQYTMKKLGWVSELDANTSLIHVPYNLPHIQVGALFIVPSGIDGTEGRVFRCIKMSSSMIYPASITCELAPEYEDKFEQAQLYDFHTTDFNVLEDEEDRYE